VIIKGIDLSPAMVCSWRKAR